MQPRDQADRTAAVLDVQLLDVLAEVEALLRSVRTAQGEVSRVRTTPAVRQRTAAAKRIRTSVGRMRGENRAVAPLIRQLERRAKILARDLRNAG